MIRIRPAVCLILLVAGPALAASRHVPKDHATIQAAIKASSPGDTVVVAPGTYRESLLLKEWVTVRSAGDDARGEIGLKRAEATILDGGTAKGAAVVMAEGAVFDGFTVTKVGAFDQKEYDRHYAERGENLPDGRGAVGVGSNVPAVSIPAVTATVRNNIVRDNGTAGIGCSGAKGKRNRSLILDNVAYRNMGGGIGVSDDATPLVEGNRCFNNLRAGIGNRNSAAVLVGNECSDNVRAGIGIREGARPVVRGNKCYKNRRAGIGCRMAGTSPVIEDNDCYQNGMAGIGCRDGAEPVIRGNRCHGNGLAGIGSRDGAKSVVVGNVCHRNKEAGIGTQSGARAVIVRNECHDNDQAGIGQRGDAQTVLEGNHVHHNKEAGIGFDECKAGRSTVTNNKVIDNAKVAIGVHGGWKVRIVDNELARKDGLPPIVMVFKGSEADVTDNTIRCSGVAGVRTEGTVRVTGNRFVCPALRKVGPPQSAVWGLPGADILFRGNTVQGWRHAVTADKAAVVATGNRVAGYWNAGMRIGQPVAPSVVMTNTFTSEAKHPGVVVVGGRAVVEDNPVEKPAGGK